MAQLIVRNLDDDVKHRLSVRAARHGHSMEQEIRDILGVAVATEAPSSEPLGTRIAGYFAGLGMDTEIPELRGQAPRPVIFDD